ncbi:hypothetical protein G9C85_13935 [Halorubellus sp. JP-L1]|uniref:DUF7130 family rubredoxin-like protein n=1 Tax=Halorubellus sp. JP-L1 TaxID=2715753 RepID=UPI00140D2361|nr:hypothetical protein [Halorubellus sp. JP-L1]NHN42722.1 hypothetical protein [Halorubellus sp. JP-L1]
MSDDASAGDDHANADVNIGETVYTEEGEPVGEIRGIKEDGLFVSTLEGYEQLSVEHVRSGQGFGEAELMWRCMECGEMGQIEDGLPDECPNCGVEREQLMYWTED